MPPFPTRAADILPRLKPQQAKADWEIALSNGDDDAAVVAYVKLIRTGPSRANLNQGVPALYDRWMGRSELGYDGGHRAIPDQLIQNHYTGAYGIQHTFENGEIDWLFDPTANWGDKRTPEWQVQFNRHYHWIGLAKAWKETGNAKYAHAFENELRSWVTQCPRPDDNGMGLPGCWRLIEVGIRMGWTWPIALDTFRQCEYVTDEAIWLMITAMHEHAMHLLLWPTKRNFKTMESNGLMQVAAMFPEFTRSFSFYSSALDRVCSELERQVYPDGQQDELAPSYGVLALANFYAAIMMAKQAPVAWAEIPQRAFDRLNDMAWALLQIATPDAMLPPIHDSPTHDITGLYKDFQEQNASRFLRKPWLAPGLTHQPWAGWVTLRRYHHNHSQYAFFDAGPWGTGHQHADALQLLTHFQGRWFCIDSGKPLYNQSALTRHIKSSAGHNVVLMDGQNHQPSPKENVALEPYPIAVHDSMKHNPVNSCAVMATAAKRQAECLDDTMKPTSSQFSHERVVLDVPALGWVVLDRLNAQDDQPHAWESLWHLATDDVTLVKEMNNDQSAWATYNNGPCMLIHPITAADVKHELSIAKGQTDPVHRGWEGHHNHTEQPGPIPVLSVKTSPSNQPLAMITLLIPAKDNTQPVVSVTDYQVNMNHVQLKVKVNMQSFSFDFAGKDEVNEITCEQPGASGPSSCTFPLSPHSK